MEKIDFQHYARKIGEEIMGKYRYYLVTIFYNNGLLKCAVEVDPDKMPERAEIYWITAEIQKFWQEALPLHARGLGPIVALEDIFAIGRVEE